MEAADAKAEATAESDAGKKAGGGEDDEDAEGDEAAVVGGDVARGEADGQMKNEPPKE